MEKRRGKNVLRTAKIHSSHRTRIRYTSTNIDASSKTYRIIGNL